MRLFIALSAAAFMTFVVQANAQSPQPVIIQAAPNTTVPAAAAAPAAGTATTSDAGALSALQEVKKANDETLAKQEATLKTLDDLQKAAEQLRILAKRS